MPATGMLRQEDHGCEASLSHIEECAVRLSYMNRQPAERWKEEGGREGKRKEGGRGGGGGKRGHYESLKCTVKT